MANSWLATLEETEYAGIEVATRCKMRHERRTVCFSSQAQSPQAQEAAMRFAISTRSSST